MKHRRPKYQQLLVSLAFVALAPATGLAALAFEFEQMLPGHGRGQSLDRPSAVTVDPNQGEICVTDNGTSSLVIYNAASVPMFQTGRASGMSIPWDGTIDAQGGFVCTDALPGSERTIKRFNFLGEALAYEPVPPAEEWYPGHLLVTRDGNYVTIDGHSGLLVKHDSQTGALLWQAELGGFIPVDAGLAGRPAEAPDGRIYLPGGEARRILVLSAEGEFLTSFGQEGTGRGSFAFPVGVAFGPAGVVLVLDRMRHTVLVFDAEHKFQAVFGSFGDGPGRFYHPVAIAAAPDGRVYVAQGYRGRVQMFRLFNSDDGSGTGGRAS